MRSFQEVVQFIREIYKTNEFIPLHEPRFRGNERNYVLDTIDSTFVSSVGAYVDKFEKMMAQLSETQKAVAVVNGTAGLQVALGLAGWMLQQKYWQKNQRLCSYAYFWFSRTHEGINRSMPEMENPNCRGCC